MKNDSNLSTLCMSTWSMLVFKICVIILLRRSQRTEQNVLYLAVAILLDGYCFGESLRVCFGE